MYAMADKGGENPYDVSYSKEKEKNIMDSQAGDNMKHESGGSTKAFAF